MAKTIPLYGYVLGDPDSEGKRAFVLTYTRVDFNDSRLYVEDGPDNPVFTAAKNVVHFEQASVRCNGFAAGVTWQFALSCGRTFMRWPLYTTVEPAYNAQVVDLRISLPAPMLRSPSATYTDWLNLYNITGYAATDDMHVTLWGWIDGASEPAPFVPVSLERYRWPLKRAV